MKRVETWIVEVELETADWETLANYADAMVDALVYGRPALAVTRRNVETKGGGEQDGGSDRG